VSRESTKARRSARRRVFVADPPLASLVDAAEHDSPADETALARGGTLMTPRLILAILVIGAVVLRGNHLAGAQTPEYRTFQPHGAGPYPAVVFASGCSGFVPSVAPKAYERAAEQLRGQGYLVLFADYLGRRGLTSCASGRISLSDAGKDVVGAATWLKSQRFVDPARISALGWSYGGGAVLAALAEHSPDQLSFSRAVVYYPVCPRDPALEERHASSDAPCRCR